ncbi:hypothetical protein QZJ86_11415 [Methylomonas montana]|uniref:hypothetical protein n=1 Tax=Methylomonas montana TaxID=3058963 RepID=UPI002659B822|nr:hypothetical protein [Methylomonas montana]WKJ88632.1 hypothetical protein QZJ86_11415 [Methylomonas montana]
MFFKIKIKYRFILLKYILYSLLKKSSGVECNDKKIIVSLTTYPKRLNVVHLAIESLLNQTIKPCKIILWLSGDEISEFSVPLSIKKLVRRGLEIRFMNGNLKSYKKLIYSIEEFPDYNIITCDDDAIYPSWFIDGLYAKHNEFPHCVVAYRCALMKKKNKSLLTPYLNWKAASGGVPSYNLFPTGVGGIFYPCGSLNSSVFQRDLFIKLAPSADDVWFKAMALINNTKTVMAKDSCIEFLTIEGTQDCGLWHKNVIEKQNDKQLKNVFDYFDLYGLIE